VNVILVGPCSVGKSVVGKSFANRAKLKYLDFDALGIADMEERKGGISPFSRTWLNFRQSVPIIMDTSTRGHVLDIGGSTVFHANADNNERLEQVLWLKETYVAQIIVLTATKDTLANRFISDKSRSIADFDATWDEWSNIAEPYWRQCRGVFIDTSFLTVNDVITQIEIIINSRHHEQS
jgi:shikimate kinase